MFSSIYLKILTQAGLCSAKKDRNSVDGKGILGFNIVFSLRFGRSVSVVIIATDKALFSSEKC